jgi:hypothetical protein
VPPPAPRYFKLRLYLIRALVIVARLAGRGARRLTDKARQQARESKGIPIRLVTLLTARLLVAIADGALWLIDRMLPELK